VVAKEHLSAWEGTAVPAESRKVEAQFRWNPDGPATDYDRACDVDDYIGLIDVGSGKAIVLGDEPLMTTWLSSADGGLLVRWVCADNEETLLAAAHRIQMDAYEDSGVSFTVGDSPLVLLAACESSDDKLYPRIEFEIPSGRYRILTSQCETDANTSLICHRLCS
jgi:frataxin-like iron-binding protein CyaY